MGLMRGKKNYPGMTDSRVSIGTAIIFDEAVETDDLKTLVIDAVAESRARALEVRRPDVPRQLVDWDGEILEWVPPDELVVRAVIRRCSGGQARLIAVPLELAAVGDAMRPRGGSVTSWVDGMRERHKWLSPDPACDAVEASAMKAGDGCTWIVCEPEGDTGAVAGECFDELPAGSCVFGTRGICVVGGKAVAVRKIALTDIDGFVSDVSTRFASLRNGSGDSVQNGPDGPIHNQPTALSLAVSMERKQNESLRCFAAWTLGETIQRDRTYREMLTYCRALYYSLTRDRLSVGSLMLLETFGRRAQGLLEAYEEAPRMRPDFSAARLFTGVATFGSADPRNRRETREEHEVSLFGQQGRHGVTSVATEVSGFEPSGDGESGQDGSKGDRRGVRRVGTGLPPAQAR